MIRQTIISISFLAYFIKLNLPVISSFFPFASVINWANFLFMRLNVLMETLLRLSHFLLLNNISLLIFCDISSFCVIELKITV